MRLDVAPGARAIEQQHLARLLRHRAPQMLLDQVRCQRRSSGTAGASDARAVGQKQAVGDDPLVRKGFEEILIVIPADAGAPAFHQPGAAQDEAARADADQGYLGRAYLAQVARCRFVDLRTCMQDPADHHYVVERLGCEQRAGRLDQHAAARRHRLRTARHDRPLHVQRAAAVAFVSGEPQVVDEHGERRQSEVVRQNHADAQRRARTAFRGRDSVYGT